MPRRGLPLALVAWSLVASAARAQSDPAFRLDAGVASIRQPVVGTVRGGQTADAALLAAYWRRPRERSTLLASGNLTYAQDSLAAMQGVAVVSVPWRRQVNLRTDAGVAGASFSLRSAGTGGNANAFVRQQVVREAGGEWIGGALGRTRRDGVRSVTGTTDLGLWRRWRWFYTSASIAYQHSSDWLLLYTAGDLGAGRSTDYDLVDLQAVLQGRAGPHDLSLSWTRRRILSEDRRTVGAWQGTGTLQLTDRIAALTSIGRQLADPIRGLPQADVVMLAVRVSLGPQPLPIMPRTVVAEAIVRTDETEDASDVGGSVRRVLEVRVEASDTSVVTVAGSFSDWKPIPLQWQEGVWVARSPIAPGTHRVGIRVGVGPWHAPRNLARVRDGFGGESGLLVVP